MFKRVLATLMVLGTLALPTVAQAKEIVDGLQPRPTMKDLPQPGRNFKESSKQGAPAEKYDYIYRVRDLVRPPDKRDVI